MKKFIALILIVTSLFTLSSSISCCAVEENSKTAEIETTNDINTTNGKEEKKIKIIKFLAEKRNWFPKNKIAIVKDCLNALENGELELVLNLDFKKPNNVTLAAILGGFFEAHKFVLGDVKWQDLITIILNTTFVYDFYSTGMFPLFTRIIIFLNWGTDIIKAPFETQKYNYELLRETIKQLKF